jgi:hypothetical protein
MSTNKQIASGVSAVSTLLAEAFVSRAASVALKTDSTCTPIFRGCPCVLYAVTVIHGAAATTFSANAQYAAKADLTPDPTTTNLFSANGALTKIAQSAISCGPATLLAAAQTTRGVISAIPFRGLSGSAAAATTRALTKKFVVVQSAPSPRAKLDARVAKTFYINGSTAASGSLTLNIHAALSSGNNLQATASCFRPVAAALENTPLVTFGVVRTAVLVPPTLVAVPGTSTVRTYKIDLSAAFKTKSAVTARTLENMQAHISARARIGREPEVAIGQITDNVPPNTGRVQENGFTNATSLLISGVTERDTTLAIAIDGLLVSLFSVGPLGLWTYSSPTLSEGLHSFSFMSFNNARNYVSKIKTFWVNVDTTPPKPPIILSVTDTTDPITGRIPQGGLTNEAQPVFRGRAEINSYVEVEITENGDTAPKPQLISVGPTGAWRYIPKLITGNYSFSFKAVDRASNKSAATVYAFNVATGVPNPPVVSSVSDNVGPSMLIPNGGLTNDPQPTFTGTADPDTTLTVRRNADTPRVISSSASWTYTPQVKLKSGVHTFYFTSKNNAGTISEETKYKIVVDVTRPIKPKIIQVTDDTSDPPIVIEEKQPTTATQPKFEGRGQKGAKLFVSIGSAVVAEITIDDERKWEYTPADPLAEGTYLFTFVVEDAAGNQSKPRWFNLVVAPPVVQPFKALPRMRSTGGAWWTLRARKDMDIAAELCVCPRIVATLTGPGGVVSTVTKKRKIRLVRSEHPDSEPDNKKYIWRIPVVEESLSCACEFIHIGMYTLRAGPWRVNEEREVVLLIVDSSGGVYPQTKENGEYRVVKVMNKMYDIYPPNTFQRWEPKGAEYELRKFINTDTVNYVFVWEGCGDGFFLINASCD